MTGDRPTRFASDLLESAAVEGKRESRSAKQQLDYWARVGRSVSMQAQSVSFGERLAAEGVTTVALDDEGALVEYRPDGSCVVLVAPDSRV